MFIFVCTNTVIKTLLLIKKHFCFMYFSGFGHTVAVDSNGFVYT